jgi:hypothetical protein
MLEKLMVPEYYRMFIVLIVECYGGLTAQKLAATYPPGPPPNFVYFYLPL